MAGSSATEPVVGPSSRAGVPWRRPHAKLFLLLSLLVSLVLLALIAAVAVTAGWIVAEARWESIAEPSRTWPRLSNIAIVVLPALAILLGALLSRAGDHATFHVQQQTNRRISLLFLLAMIGMLAALGDIIAASITFDAYAGLVGAGIAALFGLGAALIAHKGGTTAILDATGAKRITRPGGDTPGSTTSRREAVLLNVVDELSVSANMRPPAVYVIDDGSLNAMAVATDANNAAITVTRGMLDRFDREQLQGVIGHELAHVRNLDSRYGVYVAVLVGLVALVTDGFLRGVLHAWEQGLFFRGGDAEGEGALVGFLGGVAFGLFLLLVAGILRLFAPLASLLVQAAVNRQREFLADATAVELTRNPRGLSRALEALRSDRDVLEAANRGSQHLWFSSPVKKTDDVSWHMLATHPTLDARIARLSALYPSAEATATSAATAAQPAGEI